MRRAWFLIIVAAVQFGVACSSSEKPAKVDPAAACKFFHDQKDVAALYLKDPKLAEQGRTLDRQADDGLRSGHCP